MGGTILKKEGKGAGMDPFLTKNTKNETDRDETVIDKEHQEWIRTERRWNDWEKTNEEWTI